MENKIRSWLDEQGYPLEMEVASIARKNGFEVSQSDYYIDPESEDAREIDLVASRDRFDGEYNKSYNLIIECKSSKKKKPWLVFSNENELLGNIGSPEDCLVKMHKFSSFVATPIAERILMNLGISNQLDSIYPRLGVERHLGYGVTQAFTDAGDTPFKAMISATKASISNVRRFNVPVLNPTCAIAIPVVVIDSPIFSVSHNPDSNAFEISRVSCAEVLWKHLVAGKSRIGIFIVDTSNLNEFFLKCKSSSDWWLDIEDSKLSNIYSEIEKGKEK